MKYTIISINDRSINNIEKNKKILKSFDFVDSIEFFNGNIGNAWDVINHKGIRQDVWSPYDGRTSEPLPGELGIWVSTLNVLEYIVNNKIEMLLVLEDDVILQNNFVNDLQKCLTDLPKNFDFLSLFYFSGQNWVDERTNIQSDYVHRSYNQFAGAQGMIYSYRGAKKILRCIKVKGIEYTSDCFIFKQSLLGAVNGYSIKPDAIKLISHDIKNIKSTIDPNNQRNTDGE